MTRRLTLLLVCLVTLFAGPSLYAVIWGPVGVPPLGVYRDVMFWSCTANTGYEEWECDRTFTQVGSPGPYATVYDYNCSTGAESFTYWCKRSNNTWKQITYTEFENCAECT